MAQRVKTIEYAFAQSTGNVASGGARAFTQITIYIPESNPIFRSVLVESYVQDNSETAASITAWRHQIALGGGSLDTTGPGATITSTIANTGEHQGISFIRDCTNYFTANWSGTSMTFDLTQTITGFATINASAKVVITYEYSDTATTRIKTVKIPIESNTGSLTTELTEIGTNQVPNLDTFLPEASKTYRDIFFEFHTNEGTTAASATNPAMNLSLDSEAASPDGLHEDALNSARYYYRIWKRTDMATNATHALKASTDNTNMPFPVLGGILTVTYEYDHSTTTSVINSIQIPVNMGRGRIGGPTSANRDIRLCKFFIEEPETITLVQSGLLFSFIDAAAITFIVYAGSQSERTYTIPATVNCGGKAVVHRIDSGAAQGAGITLARGEVTLTVNTYRTGTAAGQFGSALTCMMFLNYTSGVSTASGGDANHNHTTAWFIKETNVASQIIETSSIAPNIPESNYWVNGIGTVLFIYTGSAANSITVMAKKDSTEVPGGGWYALDSSLYSSDAELGTLLLLFYCTESYCRHPNDPRSDRFALKTSRVYQISAGSAINASMYLLVTTHSITYTISGTVRGYTGDGSGIPVKIYRSDNYELVQTATTSTGGVYTVNWYDNTINIFAEARQDDNHVGRSKNGLVA